MSPFRLVLIGAVLVGAGAFLATRTGALEDVTTAWQHTRAVEAAVRASLKDPASAEFGPLTPGVLPESYCGSVNARNSFGGMAGARGFGALLRDSVYIVWDGERAHPDSDAGLVLRGCGLRVVP
jgi:hypothetical protein